MSDPRGQHSTPARARRQGLISDLWLVVKRERKWWLIPLLVILLLVVGLMLLAGSAGPLAPLLYPLM